jgi:hypothetical protein
MNSATMSVTEPRTEHVLDRLTMVLLLGFVAALQISIAVSQILLAALFVSWVALRIHDHTRPAVPPFFIALVAYGIFTLVSSVFSVDPTASFIDNKQLLLLAIVPAVYDIARGPRGPSWSSRWAPPAHSLASCSTACCTTTTSASVRREHSRTT